MILPGKYIKNKLTNKISKIISTTIPNELQDMITKTKTPYSTFLALGLCLKTEDIIVNMECGERWFLSECEEVNNDG